MDFVSYSNIVLIGFLVWMSIAPRLGNPRYGELFLAYMTALLFCLLATSDIIMIKPIAFFFTVGGVLAFFCTVARMTIRFRVNHK
jgi:hypothetical protein